VNPLWLWLIGVGLLLLLLGGLLLLPRLRAVRDTGSLLAAADPCRNLLAAWQKAKGDCDDARRAEEIAHATAERRVADEWVARHRMSEETRSVEADEMRSADKAGETAHASVEAAREVATRAEAQATEICRRAAAAHLAYQNCVRERGSPQAASRSR
jgi:hypothetical protein